MLKTGAKPEQAVQTANKKRQMMSAAGSFIVNSSPVLKGAQAAVNAIARSGNFGTVKEMAKEQFKRNQ